MEVLVVEPHEGELDAGEFALLDVGLGRPKAEGANLLPIGVGRRAVAGAGDFHDLGNDAVFSERRRRRQDRRACGQSGGAGRSFQNVATASLHRHEHFVDLDTHDLFLPFAPRSSGPKLKAARCARTHPSARLTQEINSRRALWRKSIAPKPGRSPVRRRALGESARECGRPLARLFQPLAAFCVEQVDRVQVWRKQQGFAGLSR